MREAGDHRNQYKETYNEWRSITIKILLQNSPSLAPSSSPTQIKNSNHPLFNSQEMGPPRRNRDHRQQRKQQLQAQRRQQPPSSSPSSPSSSTTPPAAAPADAPADVSTTATSALLIGQQIAGYDQLLLGLAQGLNNYLDAARKGEALVLGQEISLKTKDDAPRAAPQSSDGPDDQDLPSTSYSTSPTSSRAATSSSRKKKPLPRSSPTAIIAPSPRTNEPSSANSVGTDVDTAGCSSTRGTDAADSACTPNAEGHDARPDESDRDDSTRS